MVHCSPRKSGCAMRLKRDHSSMWRAWRRVTLPGCQLGSSGSHPCTACSRSSLGGGLVPRTRGHFISPGARARAAGLGATLRRQARPLARGSKPQSGVRVGQVHRRVGARRVEGEELSERARPGVALGEVVGKPEELDERRGDRAVLELRVGLALGLLDERALGDPRRDDEGGQPLAQPPEVELLVAAVLERVRQVARRVVRGHALVRRYDVVVQAARVVVRHQEQCLCGSGRHQLRGQPQATNKGTTSPLFERIAMGERRALFQPGPARSAS